MARAWDITFDEELVQKKDDVDALADEVKVLVISFQTSGHKSPYYILLASPQTNNESSRYNEDCAEICL